MTNLSFLFLGSNIQTSPDYGVYISQLIRFVRTSSSYDCFNLRARRLSSNFKLLKHRYIVERLKSSFRFYGRYGDLIKQYEVSFSRILTDMLKLNQLQRLPDRSDFSQIDDFVAEIDIYRIASGFPTAFVTRVACQQGILTLPDTW